MRFLFFYLLFFCTACDNFYKIYTIHNQSSENIMAGLSTLTPNQCVEFVDFPLFGDFPIKFRYQNRELLSEESYPPAHYLISIEGKVLKKNEACSIERVRDKVPDNPVQDDSATNVEH